MRRLPIKGRDPYPAYLHTYIPHATTWVNAGLGPGPTPARRLGQHRPGAAGEVRLSPTLLPPLPQRRYQQQQCHSHNCMNSTPAPAWHLGQRRPGTCAGLAPGSTPARRCRCREGGYLRRQRRKFSSFLPTRTTTPWLRLPSQTTASLPKPYTSLKMPYSGQLTPGLPLKGTVHAEGLRKRSTGGLP